MKLRSTLRNNSWLLGIGALMATGCKEEAVIPVYQEVVVENRDIILSASAAGAVEPVTSVEVKSKASGEIIEVIVDVGDSVSRGDLLIRVDPRVPQNGLAQAEADHEVAKAQLDNARAQLRRAESLFETQSITEQEYENARLAHATANAQLIRAERNVEDARISFQDTEVRAASRGVILERAVEVGSVIASASNSVSGGAMLMRMANLDTVQVRTLVDETDIGKINQGMDVTVTVDAYPNQPFRGTVLKIEPQAFEEQNVTMFPVLVRIDNTQGLLRPGMNSQVEIHIGNRLNVVAVPNSALRTQRDVQSAAGVLGLSEETVNQQLARAREGDGGMPMGAANAEGPTDNTMEFMGRTITLPADVTREQVEEIATKMRNGGGRESLTAADRALMQKIGGGGANRAGNANRGGGGFGGGQRQAASSSAFQYGGDYVVFVLRDGAPFAVPVKTGMTDLEYSEILSGLEAGETVLVLPSASLISQQQERTERIQRMTGGGALPGISTGGRR